MIRVSCRPLRGGGSAYCPRGVQLPPKNSFPPQSNFSPLIFLDQLVPPKDTSSPPNSSISGKSPLIIVLFLFFYFLGTTYVVKKVWTTADDTNTHTDYIPFLQYVYTHIHFLQYVYPHIHISTYTHIYNQSHYKHRHHTQLHTQL